MADLVPHTSQSPAFSSQFGVEDLALPRAFTVQASSTMALEGVAEPGQFVVATDSNDPSPHILYSHGDDRPAVLIALHVPKGTWYEDDGNIVRLGINDAPPEDVYPRTRYDVLLCIPDFSTEMPVQREMRGTAVSAARAITTVIMMKRHIPIWATAFAFTTVRARNDRGSWFKPALSKIRQPKNEHLLAAAALAVRLGIATNGDESVQAERDSGGDDNAPPY